MKLLVASYYTNETYKAHAAIMEKTANRVGLECALYEAEDKGNHVLNTHQKPGIILRALEEHKDCNILFVDADCRFRQHPSLFYETDLPFGCYFYQRDYAWSGVLWIGNPGGKPFIEAWKKLVDENPRQHTRRALVPAIEKTGSHRVLRLPPAYLWVERWFRGRFPGASPVIEDLVSDEFVPEQRDDYQWK